MSNQTNYREAFATSKDGLSLFYRDYLGETDNGRIPALCIPGMTRNSKDFEDLSPRLAKFRRVLAVDLRGRGRSESDPDISHYNPRTYMNDIWQVLDHAGVPAVVVVGTSLGGIMAMLMATSNPDRVRGAVLNDIGPALEQQGLDRITDYVNLTGAVANWDEAAEAARNANQAFLPDYGPDDWMRFARRTFVEDEADSGVRPDFDPGIAAAMRAAEGGPSEMWPIFEGIKSIPALVIRGAISDLLSEAGVDRMIEQKPDLQRVTIADRGHVPTLDEPECIAAIDAFFEDL